MISRWMKCILLVQLRFSVALLSVRVRSSSAIGDSFPQTRGGGTSSSTTPLYPHQSVPSLTMSDSTISAIGEGTIRRDSAVIIGGGPSGLATALMLAKRGWKDIAIIERSHSADHYDPNLAFVYQIDRRGQHFTDAHNLTEKLMKIAVDTKEFEVTRVPSTGVPVKVVIPVIDGDRPSGYWLPRSEFRRLLYDELVSKYPEQVKFYFSSYCESIERITEESGIELKASLYDTSVDDVEPRATRFRPQLVVGADGLKSMVRDTLRKWDEADSGGGQKARERATRRVRGRKNRFDMVKVTTQERVSSLAVLTGMFPLGYGDAERAESQKAYAVLSKYDGSKKAIRIGLLPSGPASTGKEESPRGGNIITLPDHPLWDVKTAEEVKNFLRDHFPQLPITEEVGPDELSRFAQSPGGRFPDPQFSPGIQWVVGGSSSSSSSSAGESKGMHPSGGIALVGDAIHAFPPDVGQGVNSALEDVLVLDRALASCGDRVEAALPAYEDSRADDAKALAKLCQIGFPWQYRQYAPIRSTLWNINFLLRATLNKILPSVFGVQVFLAVQRSYELSYSEIMAEANRTTRNIILMVATMALTAIFRRRIAGAILLAATSLVSLVTGAAV